MSETATAPRDHVAGDATMPPPPPPLVQTERAPRRSSAEEARTLLAATDVGALASLSADSYPWSSLVGFAALGDGTPVLLVSTMAEHGRNLERDPRASLMVAHPVRELDQLAHGRLTLAARAERPEGEEQERARKAFLAAIPAANAYEPFVDFSLWVLRPERVRWVGGYGRMNTVTLEAYAEAEADPTYAAAPGAVAHLNADHADALVDMARALGGYPDALTARCDAIDRYGIDLTVETPRGHAPTRVGFAERVDDPDGLRPATIELARRARA